jgi:hypothetical protein
MAAILLAVVLAATYLGFALLALSQDRHWHHLGGGRHCPPRLVWLLRTSGYGLLLASLVLALWRDGPSFGALVWVTALSICAFAVVATLTWRPRWLRPLADIFRTARILRAHERAGSSRSERP